MTGDQVSGGHVIGLPEGLRFRAYLGDGLYAGWDGDHIVLTAENGERVTNIVYLDGDVYLAFSQWSGRVVRELAGRPVREDSIDGIVRDLLKLIEMLMPGIGAIAVEDYALVNEAPLRAHRWLRGEKP